MLTKDWVVVKAGLFTMIYGTNNERICRMIDEPKVKNAELIINAVNQIEQLTAENEALKSGLIVDWIPIDNWESVKLKFQDYWFWIESNDGDDVVSEVRHGKYHLVMPSLEVYPGKARITDYAPHDNPTNKPEVS